MRIEVVTYRDPDAAIELEVFVEGVRVIVEHTDIDPGRGNQYNDLLEAEADAARNATPAAAEFIREWYGYALESGYTEGKPE